MIYSLLIFFHLLLVLLQADLPGHHDTSKTGKVLALAASAPLILAILKDAIRYIEVLISFDFVICHSPLLS